MPIEILMPALSPTMKEGNLAKWLKNEGDKIKPGDIIAEIETDKATMEVESIDSGILAKIIVPSGTENVSVNSLIAVILEDNESSDKLEEFISSKADLQNNIPKNIDKENNNSEIINKSNTSIEENFKEESRIKASPLARKIAQQNGINLKDVWGTGPHGRIIKDDVLKLKENNPNSKKLNDNILIKKLGRNSEEFTKISNNNMRKVIARRLTESKQNVPHFYLSIECNIDKLLDARMDMNNIASKTGQEYKISVNDFMIKASAMALKSVPDANASWTEEAILKYNNIDISVAVAIDSGLITPIIFNADQKSLSDISNEMKDLASRARANKLAPHEFQGGSFSISNLGMYGIKTFNAIINPPQACIIAIGAGEKKPVIINDKIEIATIVSITLSCDHRVVDGAVGARFLEALKNYVENPVMMLV